MPRYLFEERTAFDPVTNQAVANATLQVFDVSDTNFATPLTVYDSSGLATTTLRTGSAAVFTDFFVDDRPKVRVKSGSYSTILTSYDALQQIAATAVSQAQASAASAATALDQLQDLIAAGGPGNGGGGGTVILPGPRATWANFTGGYCQHRTGGSGPDTGYISTAVHLPGSIAAGEFAIAMGHSFLDIDLAADAEGTIWVTHDKNDLSLTTQLTGAVAKAQSSLIDGARILASKTTGGKYQDQPLVTLRRFLAHFNGRIPILAEPKDQAAGAEWATTVARLQKQAAGYLDSVIFTISASNVDTNASVIDAAGLPWGFYHQSANVNDATIRQQAISAHCKNVMVTTNALQATVEAYKTGGVTVIGYGNGRRSTIAAYAALGVTGIMDEFVGHVSDPGLTVAADPWRQGFWGTGDVPATNHARPLLQADGTGLLFNAPYTDGRQWMLASEFSPLPSTFQLDMHLQVVGATTSGNWIGVNVCNQSDASFSDNLGADPTGYSCYLFPGAGSPGSGIRIDTREASTTTNRATGSISAVVPADGDYWLRVVVDGTSVVASRRDSAGAQIGTSATYASTTWRGGFLHVGGPLGSTMRIKVLSLNVGAIGSTDAYTAPPSAGATTTYQASMTLVLGNADRIVEMSTTAANVVTVPTAATVAFPVGTQIVVRQFGTGATSVAAASGVTIRSRGGVLALAGQYAEAVLTKRDTNEWVLSRDIA